MRTEETCDLHTNLKIRLEQDCDRESLIEFFRLYYPDMYALLHPDNTLCFLKAYISTEAPNLLPELQIKLQEFTNHPLNLIHDPIQNNREVIKLIGLKHNTLSLREFTLENFPNYSEELIQTLSFTELIEIVSYKFSELDPAEQTLLLQKLDEYTPPNDPSSEESLTLDTSYQEEIRHLIFKHFTRKQVFKFMQAYYPDIDIKWNNTLWTITKKLIDVSQRKDSFHDISYDASEFVFFQCLFYICENPTEHLVLPPTRESHMPLMEK